MKTKKIKESELENDKRTLEKRNKVKEKLKGICNSGQDIDDILTSLERYCLVVIQSIKTDDYG